MPRQVNLETAYRPVQGLARGLAVLRGLNLMGRPATIPELSASTGLHRTTVRRLLETLVSQGYVTVSTDGKTYALTIRVRDLSEGFTDHEWIASIALPVMGRLMQQVKWPSDLTVLDGTCMRVRESTHRFSSLSFERAMVGRRLPLTSTASGRAYLAACDAVERETLLQMVVAESGAAAVDWKRVQQMVAKVRRNRYANAEGEWRKTSPAGAIALPILWQGRVLACLNVVYLRGVIRLADAVADLLPPLRLAVEEIQQALAQHDALR